MSYAPLIYRARDLFVVNQIENPFNMTKIDG